MLKRKSCVDAGICIQIHVNESTGVSLFFSRSWATGFHRWAKLFEPNFFLLEKISSKSSNQANKILLTAGQFALNETPGQYITWVQGTCTMNGVTFYTWWQERNAYPDCCKPAVGLLFKWALQEKIKYMLNQWLFKISTICKLVSQASMLLHWMGVYLF